MALSPVISNFPVCSYQSEHGPPIPLPVLDLQLDGYTAIRRWWRHYKERKKKEWFDSLKTKQNKTSCMNILTQEVWVKSAITPACESAPHCFLRVIPLTLSPCPPGWDYLWWVNELNVALACMISPWSVWIKWSIFCPSDAHISEFRLNPSRQVFSDPELNLACKWICLCWINSDGNLPTLDGRAFYQCVLPQGFRLYKIQLDTLKKMHSHGGIRVEVREPWLNLLKSFFSLCCIFSLFLSCYCLVFPSPSYQCNMSGSTLLCLRC